LRYIVFLCLSILLISCGENGIIKVIDSNGEPNGYFIGSDATLEIVTWNLETFPLNGAATIDLLADMIDSLDVDIIAMQEIMSNTELIALDTQLIDWSSYRAASAYEEMNLAYLYKNENITIDSIYEIYTEDSDAFPRSPLVMKFHYNSMPYVIINNHLKAFTDDESQERRREACLKLEQYCEANFPYDNVFIVGDLNDSLTDPEEENVFWNFLNSPNYLAADINIATGNSSAWSYFLLSHIDHIIISNELFDEYNNEASKVITLKVENMLEGGESEYKNYISDHRPVGIKLSFE